VSVPVLDPQIIAVLRKSEAGAATEETQTPEELRSAYLETCREQFGPVEEVQSVEDRDADGVAVRIYRPAESGEPMRALVYFHGGGWVVGSVDTHDGLARAFANRTPCVVVSVDYRLAPEHPYPAALEDAWKAASWVMKNAKELGLDEEKVGVGGDSVGGCLAAIVARRGRDHGTPFATQLLIYPTTTSRQETPSYSYFALGYGLTRDRMAWYWRQYLGDYDGSNDPDVSPSALSDMRRLPRALVVTAEADVLRDEAETYAQRLFLSGVETEGYQYEGMIHGFLRMAGTVDRSQKAIDEIAESLAPFLDKGWREDFSVTLQMPENEAPAAEAPAESG
jgi:acetyl esterase